MSKIAILVDSTSGITHEYASSFGNLYMISLQFIFDNESYIDGVDLNSEQFFKKAEALYEQKQIIPTTSQPSIGECIEKYEELLATYDQILYLTISSKMSGTYQSAVMAAAEFGDKVIVFDSYTTSVGLKVLAEIAAILAAKSKGMEEIVKTITTVNEQSKIYFVVDDLKYLRRTGRIGAAASSLGNALQLKPLLKIENGEVTNHEKIRNLTKAHRKLVQEIIAYDLNSEDIVYIIGTGSKAYGAMLKQQLLEHYDNPQFKIMEGELSPVISNNTGPGVCGMAVFKDVKKYFA